MGEYAEAEIEREMLEAAGLDERRDPAPARTAFADRDLQEFARQAGLRVSAPSPHHLQVRKGGEVVAEWWPGRGTTRAGGRRGRRCREVADFIRWIKSEGRI
ncbi:MAG TPA: hypothetical protein P5234_16000 [Thermoanaerobaculaceae bacterium]|nr:hypothetical protein [Thermoanaerobaculaceae bacterium]HRU10501.1 hypothetical protein [Thermoanaerobaculia bacterium]